MRIIAGTHKGRRITPPSNLPVRPTTDLAREALFNLLQSRFDVESATVFDLFSGTGFVAYEFHSRGALSVIAIEQNFRCVNFIKSTAATLSMNNIKVIRSDAIKFLKNTHLSADIIFADPPYDAEFISEIPDLVFKSNSLNEEGLLILEHGKTISFEGHKAIVETKNYGKVFFSFFSKKQFESKEAIME